MKNKHKYNLWLSLPFLFFVNFAINGWLWSTIQYGNSELGVASRAFGAIASFVAIPFSNYIEKKSWGFILTIACSSLVLGILLACLGFSTITISSSTFLISIAGYLMVFRTQIEFSNLGDGANKLRNFTTWYGTVCTIAPWLAGYWAQYFEIKNTWVYLLTIVTIAFLCFIYHILKAKKGKKIKINQIKRGDKRNSINSWLSLIKDAEAMRLVRQSIIFSGTMSTLNLVIPLWALSNGWSSGDAGTIIGITGLSSLFVRLIFNRIKWDEKSAQIFVQYSSWICALIFGIWPWVSSWYLAIGMAALYGITYGLSAPLSLNLYAWLAKRREHPGVIWGMRSFVGASLSVSAPVIFGAAVGAGYLNAVWSLLSFGSIALDHKQIGKNIKRKKIWWSRYIESTKVKTLPPEDCH